MQALLTSFLSGALNIPPEATLTVFRNNADGYPFFRIPSLVAINSTLLLAFAEARGQRTDHGRVDIVLKRSEDGGSSWSALTLVTRGMSGTIGNPAPLVDDDLITLFFCRTNLDIFSTSSADFGATWSVPAPLAGWSRPPEWLWVATGPPAALRTSRGRWVLPCDGLTGSSQLWKADRHFSFVLLSDDRGASWQQGPLLDGGNECQAAELPNASLVLNMRSKELVRLHALSEDGGLTWSPPRRATTPVTDGNCQGSMVALSGGSSLLLATNVGIGRRVLTARTSRDGGQRWATHAILEAGAAAGYSALADLGRGWAGCLYEAKRPALAAGDGAKKRGPSEEDVLVFVRFNVSAATEDVEQAATQQDEAASDRGAARGEAAAGVKSEL